MQARQLAAELVPICKQLLELLVKMRKVKVLHECHNLQYLRLASLEPYDMSMASYALNLIYTLVHSTAIITRKSTFCAACFLPCDICARC